MHQHTHSCTFSLIWQCADAVWIDFIRDGGGIFGAGKFLLCQFRSDGLEDVFWLATWPPFQRKELLITAQSFVHLGLFWYLWCFWCLEYFEFRSCCFRGRLLTVHLFKEKKNSIERTLNCSKFCWWPVVGWRGGVVFQIIISNFSFLAVNCKNCYWQPELQRGLP